MPTRPSVPSRAHTAGARATAALGTAGSSCPGCAALLTRDSEWCSLCFTDLRPAPAPEVPPAPAPTAVTTAGDGAYEDQVLPFDVDPGAVPGGPVDPERTVEAMLARLAAAESHDPLSSLGVAGSWLRSSRGKATVIILGTLLLAGLELAAMAIVGALTA